MEKLGDWLILMAYCAIVFVLVRPKSQGPSLVSAFAQGIQGIVTSATGGGTWGG